jgi:hypothetical protein
MQRSFFYSVMTVVLAVLYFPTASFAFSGADTAKQQRAGVGSGPSLSGETPLFELLSLGGSLSSPFLFKGTLNSLQYNTFINYPLYKQKGFYISGILGFYGDYNFASPEDSSFAALQGGAAFAYDLNRELTLRVNIVPGMALHLPPKGWTFLSPVGGAAIIWRPQPKTEVSLGINGMGDILGYHWIF